MSSRETREAVLLLLDLKKPVELICRQLEITPEDVERIARNRNAGPVQQRLFE